MAGALVFSHIVSTMATAAADRVWIAMGSRCLVETAHVAGADR